jgi:RNA polymerase primary sigma factor
MNQGNPNRQARLFTDPDPLTAYLHDIRDTRKLSSRREKELAARIQLGDGRALNELVQANLKFAVAVCRRYENRGLPLSDLINEGNLGLMRAAERFSPDHDCRFTAYAARWIRQALMAALSDPTRVVRLSTSTVGMLRKLNQASRKLAQRLGRKPSVCELELETGMEAGRIRACLDLMASPLSPDRKADGGCAGEFAEGVAADPESDAELERFYAKLAMDRLLKGMERRGRGVLGMYYGLKQGRIPNLSGMMKRLGLSGEWVRQIKAKAIAKLKALMMLTAKYPCVPPENLPLWARP